VPFALKLFNLSRSRLRQGRQQTLTVHSSQKLQRKRHQ
jgi:hypothetical protein